MRLMEQIASKKTYIIAEMSANHGGSLSHALEVVSAAAEAGADCLKIQTYTADTMTLDVDKPYFKLTKGLWAGYTRYHLYEEAYTPWEWQGEIAARCKECGIDFLSTAFDFSSVDFLESLGVEAYKIASFELTDIPLLRYAAKCGKPMLISTGMGTKEEIEEAVQAVREVSDCPVILLKCTSEYPAVYADMNISVIPRMQRDFGCPVGLSDHSLGSEVAVSAVTLGAAVVEKHFCISRKEKSPDAAFSMEKEEFRQMTEAIRHVEAALGSGEYSLTEQEQGGRINRRSLFVRKDIRKGDLLTEENIALVRPAHGLHPRMYDEVIGKRALRDKEAGDPLTEGDYGQE